MFNLVENNFLNDGTCHYTDEFQNKAFMRKKDNIITAKLRFKNDMVHADAIYITIPPTDNENGTNMSLHYFDGREHNEEDVTKGIENFTSLVQKWIQMVYDIMFLDADKSFLMKIGEKITEEDIAYTKLSRIEQYDELKPVISAIFKDSK